MCCSSIKQGVIFQARLVHQDLQVHKALKDHLDQMGDLGLLDHLALQETLAKRDRTESQVPSSLGLYRNETNWRDGQSTSAIAFQVPLDRQDHTDPLDDPAVVTIVLFPELALGTARAPRAPIRPLLMRPEGRTDANTSSNAAERFLHFLLSSYPISLLLYFTSNLVTQMHAQYSSSAHIQYVFHSPP